MTGDDKARYARQILLVEVGAAGQERIAAATAAVAGQGLAHRIAERYALRAGFADVAPGPLDVESLGPADIAHHRAPRAVLAGARAALGAVRSALKGRR